MTRCRWYTAQRRASIRSLDILNVGSVSEGIVTQGAMFGNLAGVRGSGVSINAQIAGLAALALALLLAAVPSARRRLLAAVPALRGRMRGRVRGPAGTKKSPER